MSGIRGSPRTPLLKVSIAYFYGYKAVGTLVYSWPEAYDKARAADRILRQRLKDLGLEFEQVLTEFVGASATHGALSGKPDPEAPEIQLRVGVRARERAPVEREDPAPGAASIEGERRRRRGIRFRGLGERGLAG